MGLCVGFTMVFEVYVREWSVKGWLLVFGFHLIAFFSFWHSVVAYCGLGWV